MLLTVVMVLAVIAIWRIGKSVFAPPPAEARSPAPGVGASRPVPPSPPPVPAQTTPAGTPQPMPVLPSWAVLGGDEPVVRFTQPPARLARGSASPPVKDTRLVERLAIPVATTPSRPAVPPLPRRQGLYHVSHPAHGLDEVPRRRKP